MKGLKRGGTTKSARGVTASELCCLMVAITSISEKRPLKQTNERNNESELNYGFDYFH